MELLTDRVSNGMMDVTRSVDVKMLCLDSIGVNRGLYSFLSRNFSGNNNKVVTMSYSNRDNNIRAEW